VSRSIEVSLLGRFVNVTYDVSADVLRIVFSNLPIAESDEDKPDNGSGCSNVAGRCRLGEQAAQ
jgi:hypothetical protein